MKALVTGASGFVGRALVRRLIEEGLEVRALTRHDDKPNAALGAEIFRADIRDLHAVTRACVGIDVVFHTAAKAGGWGRAKDFEDTNILGTQNVISGCKNGGVPMLVYTSTPSVVHTQRDIIGGDERLPYATHFTAHYPRTKAIAEQMVRAATSSSFSTISLRPHLIWGPGDNHLLPRLMARAKTGRLRRIGSKESLTDTTYIDNCTEAHWRAFQALKDCPSGLALFISDDNPIGVWRFANSLLRAAGVPPIEKRMSQPLAYAAAACFEASHKLLKIEKEPLLTRFAVTQLTHAQWFNISGAKLVIKYKPIVSIEEGFRRLEHSLSATLQEQTSSAVEAQV